MLKKIALLVFVLSFCCSSYSAVVYNEWRGTTSDWNVGSNWNYGYVPKIVTDAGDNIRAGFKGTYVWPVITSSTSPTPEAYNITLGGSAGGTLTINSGSLNVGQYLFMGVSAGENGTLNVNGGTITTGTLTPTNGHFTIGQSGSGTVNMTGGTITLVANGAAGQLRIAQNSGAVGKLNLNGGVIYANSLIMPFAAVGAMDLGGGTLIINGDATGTVNPLVANKIIVAYNDAGTVEVDYNIINPGKTTVRGAFANPKATNPSPAHGAGNIATNAVLSWTIGVSAVSHNVYFGTASPGESQGNQSETTFNPGTLEYGKTYYWRIDEVDGLGGVTTGDVWSFTTITGQATNPTPVNGAINVSSNPTLSWTAGPGTESHNVYFGTESPGTSQGNQSTTTFNPGTLLPNTTYYWRIDEVAGTDTITGNVWSFTTAQSKAYNPNPANSATNVSIGTNLSWSAGGSAVSHDVYLGTLSPGTFKGNQPDTTYSPDTLAANTTYYWRIDEKDSLNNTETGDVWSFTTGNPPQVYPYLSMRNDPNNSIVVNWFNPVTTGDSSVDYGLTSSYGSTVNIPTMTNYHHVELTGLTPGTTYHYRIRSSDGTFGSDNTFTTASAQINTFSFAVFGDPRGGQTANEPFYSRHEALCNWIKQNGFNFALQTGDTVWGGSASVANPLGAQNFYLDFYRLERNLAGSVPIMATMGNHEVQTVESGGTKTYTYYYELYEGAYPTNGPPGNTGRIYSFDYGNVHFVCLSSYQINWASQGTWLDTDLAAARANPNIKWIFAFMHYPMYTTSGHSGDAPQVNQLLYWKPVFDKYHVDVVFAGHNHCYERTKSLIDGQVVEDGEGTVYVTSGMGGAEFNGTAPSPLFAASYGSQIPGHSTVATCVTVNGNYVTLTSIKNTTGEIIDTFQLVPPYLEGDFDENGTVDAKDLGIFSLDWLGTGLWP